MSTTHETTDGWEFSRTSRVEKTLPNGMELQANPVSSDDRWIWHVRYGALSKGDTFAISANGYAKTLLEAMAAATQEAEALWGYVAAREGAKR